MKTKRRKERRKKRKLSSDFFLFFFLTSPGTVFLRFTIFVAFSWFVSPLKINCVICAGEKFANAFFVISIWRRRCELSTFGPAEGKKKNKIKKRAGRMRERNGTTTKNGKGRKKKQTLFPRFKIFSLSRKGFFFSFCPRSSIERKFSEVPGLFRNFTFSFFSHFLLVFRCASMRGFCCVHFKHRLNNVASNTLINRSTVEREIEQIMPD